jgi:hypothetical protein
MQHDEDTLKPWQFIIWLLVIFALTAFGIIYFCYYLYALLQGLGTAAADITLNKGAFYCLGAAMMGAMLSYFGVRKIQNKPVTPQLNKQASRFFFISLIVAIALPQLLHFPTQSYLHVKGYSQCELQSRQWMHDKVMVFTATPDHCIEMTITECREDPDKQKCSALPQYFNGKAVTF